MPHSRALVIDCNATSRSILVSQLRDFGITNVMQCGRIEEARTQLELRTFDIVLCEQGFAGTDYSGQQLLDDLRRHQLLPMSTVFVMITNEASYTKVAEAAESALDSYLLKPHTAASLSDRLQQARRRKKVLGPIFQAIEQGRMEDAASLCLQRFNARGEYWVFAARIGAELLLNLGSHAQARELFDAVVMTQAVPWARLGIARAQVAGSEMTTALRTLESLIADEPTFVDAYDVMGRLLVEQGNFDGAVAVYRQAAEMTPGSVGRLQKLGTLAFYIGDRDEAGRALERAVTLGMHSKMFDFQSLVLLAFTRFKEGDSKGLQRCSDRLAQALARAPASRRLQRLSQVVRVLTLMIGKQVGDAVQAVRELALDVREESFDFEAGCNLLSLLAELTSGELKLDGVEDWIDKIGQRHCTSKSFTELLGRTACAHPPFAERVKGCHQHIAKLSERAMAHSLSGNPAAAVRALLQCGRDTLNSKLIDTARLVLQRHQGRIEGATELLAEADDLCRRYASSTTKTPLGDATGRAAGGVALRTPRATSH